MSIILLLCVPLCILIISDSLSWFFPTYESYFTLIQLFIFLYGLLLSVYIIYSIIAVILSASFSK